MKVIDIGCGNQKVRGSIGIDNSPLVNPDLCLDLNVDSLPFEDDSIDLAYASHSLEHLTMAGFMNVMSETYRVLRPGAQFLIVGPYFSGHANLANPFHNNKVALNEHTFRFFSSDPTTTALASEEYWSPSCPQWGLRFSANADIGIEFQASKLGFFYFPEYRNHSKSDQLYARKSQFDVVEQIWISLTAIKPLPKHTPGLQIPNPTDVREHVSNQLDYINLQLEHLKRITKNKKSVLEKAEVFANAKELNGGDQFEMEGVIFPANFMAHLLDEQIQMLRHSIDSENGILRRIFKRVARPFG